MAHRLLQIRRGIKSKLPQLSEGEFGFVKDEEKVYIGKANGEGNLLVGGAVSKYVTAKLLPANWANNVYDFETTYPSTECDLEISPGSTCTKEQLEAYCNAMIVGGNSSNKIRALGAVPVIEIPIKIKVVSK